MRGGERGKGVGKRGPGKGVRLNPCSFPRPLPLFQIARALQQGKRGQAQLLLSLLHGCRTRSPVIGPSGLKAWVLARNVTSDSTWTLRGTG